MAGRLPAPDYRFLPSASCRSKLIFVFVIVQVFFLNKV